MYSLTYYGMKFIKKKANKNDIIYFLMKMFKVNHISWSIKMNMKGDGKGYGYWENIIF